MHAALAQARPGVPPRRSLAAVQTLTEGLLRLGLLKGTLEKNLSEGLYQRFYRHKTGHWIGLDVHDVGDYRLRAIRGCWSRAWHSPSSRGCTSAWTIRRGTALARHRHPYRG